ncbi:RhoGEF Rgf3 [Schizosaccharomyces japonicus yFS275]|uniref:RhoGEF Rgf3 n=1 Tax=Schizosaccharomyces japonicus (strain yFS275 / FY16936) TaxID=402676 RepID=B6K4Y9_SCHJY|nr:RhoGEF Rgf3 [Schizosaccharomyces japonicus yFS275]EEB08546.2 RhoGEF Rgf3 [Schizosaccharomyces japonicus yFS275]
MKCRDPWSLNSLYKWCRDVLAPLMVKQEEGGYYHYEVAQAMATLFTLRIPKLDFLLAEMLAKNILIDWIREGVVNVLNFEKLLIEFNHKEDLEHAGVLPALTTGGCYSYTCCSQDRSDKCACYSSRCLHSPLQKCFENADLSNSWNNYWNLPLSDELPGLLTKKEITRQNNIHELICKESEYVADLDSLADLFRDGLLKSETDIIPLGRLADFIQSVFGNVETIRTIHSHRFLPQLLVREKLQGPIVSSIGDVILEWIRVARDGYINYARQFPLADETYKFECQRNTCFAKWLAGCRMDPRCRRLDFQHFLQRPTQRLQRYTLELNTILKHTDPESLDYKFLTQALKDIRATCEECDAVIATVLETNRIRDLSFQLLFKNNEHVNLDLRSPLREFFYEGEVLRKSNSRLEWLNIHLFLLDNYLVMTKVKRERKSSATKYLVSKRPIPLDLLVVERIDDLSLHRSSPSRMFGNFSLTTSEGTFRTRRSSMRLNKFQSQSTLSEKHKRSNSDNTLSPGRSEKQQLFAFAVRHLGRTPMTYTFYTETAQARKIWIEKLNFAQKRHAQKQHDKVPFAAKVLSDVLFKDTSDGPYFNSSSQDSSAKIDLVEGSVVDRALQEASWKYPIPTAGDLPNAIASGPVFSIAQFCLEGNTVSFFAATCNGVFYGEHGKDKDIRSWRKVFDHRRVTQLGVLEEFDLLLELRDKTLFAHKLSQIIELTNPEPFVERGTAQVLGTPHAVSQFKIAKVEEGSLLKRSRTYILYKEMTGTFTFIRCCEPVVGFGHNYQKAYGFRQKDVISFRVVDQFQVTNDTSFANVFKYSFAVTNSKGIEVIRLDPKLRNNIPSQVSLYDSPARNFAMSSKPLSLLRTSKRGIFACCYETGAFFVTSEGQLTRTTEFINWLGTPEHVCMVGDYLLSFDKNFVEIWSTETLQLEQIIQGNSIQYHPSGSEWHPSGIMPVFSMTHPVYPDRRLIMALELTKLGNELP